MFHICKVLKRSKPAKTFIFGQNFRRTKFLSPLKNFVTFVRHFFARKGKFDVYEERHALYTSDDKNPSIT